MSNTISVADLSAWREGDAPHVVLDVREDHELAICALEHALHIPMGQVPARLAELPRDKQLVVMCHHGMRSAQAAAWLRRAGHDNVTNLDGGIDDWARKIDTGMATY